MGSKAGTLDDIRVSKRGPSGRATIVSAVASVKAVDLRQQIGPDRLYSTTWTSVKPEGNYIVLKAPVGARGRYGTMGCLRYGQRGQNRPPDCRTLFPKAVWTQLYK